MVGGQADTLKANPYFTALAADELHLRGLVARLNPREFEAELTGEFRAAERLIALCSRIIAEQGVRQVSPKGGETAHCLVAVRKNAQTHLRGLTALMQRADATLPVEDPELERLLGG